ncbi:5-oxoprolinase subunit C family protein [Pseudodonghicola flavimaris]|uniref:Biotin-dependent carboxyltransferase family protein n=1 Tax=Pseudodonghicola flavimaris TaxID=3050036 RepID=A0ABT7F5H7_9RHOB|nr:biotin-dependent carboxyltransferase family protein [Pseudodonghicola flavimaris]MDK3019864.1 biotin-dependent carboxyltransferase family protein [Pseudodonghicola flavimaris]
MSRSFTTDKPGLQTCVQELPGRIGFLEQGFPLSGPFDAWSFRQANILVGNDRDTAALECQFAGPTLTLETDALVAVTGADMRPKIDGEPVPMWTTLPIRAGQTLALGPAMRGARSYIAISGGIATDPVLGSRAVFHQAGVGGHALTAGQSVPLGTPTTDVTLSQVPEAARPVISSDKRWQVEALAGPNDDWLTPETVETFFSADWAIQAKSSRTGVRLTGPEFAFSARATDKNPDHGQDPSNIIDHGYPMGAVNLAGQTPIILVNDSPSTGGFINPFTVASAAFWKLAQARPGEVLNFRRIDRDEAGRLRAHLDAMTRPEVLERV